MIVEELLDCVCVMPLLSLMKIGDRDSFHLKRSSSQDHKHTGEITGSPIDASAHKGTRIGLEEWGWELGRVSRYCMASSWLLPEDAYEICS